MSKGALLPSGFDGWWNAVGDWVEAANQRRGGESGVQKIVAAGHAFYSKRQIGHLYRSLRHPRGQPTVLREAEAYRAFASAGIKVPRLVFHGARKQDGQWQALLVTEELAGFLSLDIWYREVVRTVSAETRRAMVTTLGEQLARLHRTGWQHGCLYAKHIFVRASDGAPIEVALIDLEKCRRRLFPSWASGRDIPQFKRHRGDMPDADWEVFIAAYRQRFALP